MLQAPFDTTDPVVALAGDWHGDVSWVQRVVPWLRKQHLTTVYQVGDLGWFGPNDRFGDSLEYWLKAAGVTLVCSPGNHDDWDAINGLFAANGNQPAQITEHAWVIPRGYRWTHGGRSFVALGGAPSIDRDYRFEGKNWWAGEAITAADVATVAAGGHAEVMLTHDAPLTGTEAVRRIRVQSDDPQFRLDFETLAYVDRGADLMQEAYDAVLPDLLVHGHFHVKATAELDGGRRVLSLARNGMPGNLASLDLATLETTWLRPYHY